MRSIAPAVDRGNHHMRASLLQRPALCNVHEVKISLLPDRIVGIVWNVAQMTVVFWLCILHSGQGRELCRNIHGVHRSGDRRKVDLREIHLSPGNILITQRGPHGKGARK